MGNFSLDVGKTNFNILKEVSYEYRYFITDILLSNFYFCSSNDSISCQRESCDLIEIDTELVKNLIDKFKDHNFLNVINNDILKYDIKNNYDLVVSNLPYNISSQVLIKLSLMREVPNEMILMFQKEFATKLLEDKLNSINSIINCFFKIRLKFHVSKNCYRPIPKVDSSVLKFEKLNKSLIKTDEIESFIKFKRYLFSYKRKSLRNLLKKYKFNENTNLSMRAESLKLKELIKIFREINS
ncbi:MAG: ribosomal RNA small subunit methyltransferase A [Gammaproteobacteria bacterium]